MFIIRALTIRVGKGQIAIGNAPNPGRARLHDNVLLPILDRNGNFKDLIPSISTTKGGVFHEASSDFIA